MRHTLLLLCAAEAEPAHCSVHRQLRAQHRPLCPRGPPLLLLFSLASLSDSTEVLLEWRPSSVSSSTLSSADAGGVGPMAGSTSSLPGGLAGAADSALDSAALLSASAVDRTQPTCHLKTLRLGHFNIITDGSRESLVSF